MKKVKILFFLVIGLLLLTFVKLGVYSQVDGFRPASTKEVLQFSIYIFTILTLVFSHILIARGLWLFTKQGFFNIKSIQSLKIGGILLAIYGLIATSFRLYTFYSYQSKLDFSQFQLLEAISNGYTIILGFGLLTVADILRNGLVLKKEQDLTI